MPAPQDRKAVWGWAFYDWANSAFATTVMAGLLGLLFDRKPLSALMLVGLTAVAGVL